MINALWNWLYKGGPVMIPIVGFSIVAVAFVIERFIYLHKINRVTQGFTEKVTDQWESGKLDEVLKLCESDNPNPLSNMLKAGFSEHHKDHIKDKIQASVVDEIHKLEKGLSAIAVIATLEPMLGLLGTVTGMIRCFTVIALKGTGDPHVLAGGISEALITTEAGLIISIPLIYLHNVLSGKVDKIATVMEKSIVEFTSIIKTTKKL